jgi:hydroxymethylpyrimidine/phosphomethylpyrimidine kinase
VPSLPIPYDVVAAQLDAVLDDLDPVVVKTGMLAHARGSCASSPSGARGRLLVVDPGARRDVGRGARHRGPCVAAYVDVLLPVATVATPNEEEFEALGRPSAANVLVTRGGDIATTNDHGTGCTHSAALAAHLAHGADLPTAAARADAFVARQLHLGKDWTLGRGRGPVAHVHATPTQGEIA